jgi:fibronectin-binding autotransporter adhesin
MAEQINCGRALTQRSRVQRRTLRSAARRRFALLLGTALPLALPGVSRVRGATSKYYVGTPVGSTYYWNSTADWSITVNGSSGAAIPTTGDSVFITTTDGINRMISYDYSGAAVALGSLTINQNNHGAATANTNTLLLNNSSDSLSVTGLEDLGYSGLNNNYGTGVISQSAGTNTIGNSALSAIVLGWYASDIGTYQQTGGIINNTYQPLGVNGPDYSAELLGMYGTGIFNQSGGTNTIGTVEIGAQAGSAGTFTLSGTGALSATDEEVIGTGANGVFNQTGGTNTVGNYFYLGYEPGIVGTYTLSGTGILNLTNLLNESIGFNGVGHFNQSGGTQNTPAIVLGASTGSMGTYLFTAGTLNERLGEIVGEEGTGLFNQTGGVHNAGTLVEPYYVAVGDGGVGTYLLSGTGQLSVIGDESIGQASTGTSSGGMITLYGGTFNQSSGSNTLTGFLTVGQFPSATGQYVLSGGTLQVGTTSTTISSGTYIGGSGIGSFVQTGGIANTATLGIGQAAGSSGSISLNGGTLAVAGAETIGVSGAAVFTQTSGTHTAGTITVAAQTTSLAAFNISGGTTNVSGGLYIGQSGIGSVNFTGGTLNVGEIGLGLSPGGNGSLSISNGTVNVVGSIGVGGSPTSAGGTGTLNVSSFSTFNVAGGITVYPGSGNSLSIVSEAIVNATTVTLYNQANLVSVASALKVNETLNFLGGGSPTLNLGGYFVSGISGELLLSGNVNCNVSTGTASISAVATGGYNTYPGEIDLENGNRAFNISQGAAAVGLSISAMITDGSLTKYGTGTLLLSGSNAYTGFTFVAAGTLQLGNQFALAATSNVTEQSGAAIDLNGYNVSNTTAVLNGLGLGGTGALLNTSSMPGGLLGTISFTTPTSIGGTGPITLPGALSGNGAIIKIGTDTLTLSGGGALAGGLNVSAGLLVITGSNSFTGGILVNGGTLAVSADNQLGVSTNNVTLGTGGTLEATATFSSARSFIGAGGSLSVDSGQVLTLTGPNLAGSGTFISTGLGTIQSSGSSGFSGALVISNGTFSLNGSTGALPAVKSIDIGVLGTLSLNSSSNYGGNQTSQDRINDSASVTLDGGTFLIKGLNGQNTTETVGQLIPASGASSIVSSTKSNGTTAITFASLGNRSAGATVDFSYAFQGNEQQFIFASGVASGALGGWATFAGIDFAKYSSSGVVPFDSTDYTVNSFTASANVYLDPGQGTVPSTVGILTIASLNMEADVASIAVNQSAGSNLTISSGGLISNSAAGTTQALSISGGTISSGSGELDISLNSSQLTVSSALSTSDVSIRGLTGGSLTLQNATPNNFSTIILNSGTLNLNSPTIAIPGNLILNGGTLNSEQSGQFASTSIVVINGGTWNLNGKTETISQVNNSGGTLLFEHGTLNVTNGFLITGGTTTIASILNSSALISVSGGSNTVGGGGVVTTNALTFLGSNSPAVQVASNASSPGKLVLSAGGSLGFGGTGTAALASTGTAALPGVFDLNNSTNHTVTVSPGGTLMVSTAITDGGFSVTGGGTFDLTGANNYSGGTTVGNATTLMAASTSALGASGSTVTLAGGTLALRSDATTSNFPYSIAASNTSTSTMVDIDRVTYIPNTMAGTFNLSGMTLGSGNASLSVTGNDVGTLVVGNGSGTAATIEYNAASPGPEYFHTTANLTFNGAVVQSGGSVDVFKDQPGTLTFVGSGDNSFGNVAVVAGTLILAKASGIAIPNNLSIVGSSIVQFAASNQINPASSVMLNGSTGTPTLNLNGFNNTFGSNGSGGISFFGGGTLGSGTGTIILGSDVSLTTPINTATISGNLNLGSTVRTFTVARGTASVDMQISAVISGSVGLTKAGAGILYLSGANTFTGPVMVNAGILKVDSDANLGASTNVVTVNGGTLISGSSLTHQVQIGAGGGTAEIDSNNSVLISMGVVGSGELVKTGTGTLVLSAANTFSGGLSIGSGTVEITSDLNLGASGSPLIFSGGTLIALAGITNNRPFSVTGTGSVFNTAAGAYVTSGVTSFSGNLTLAAGTLEFNLSSGTPSIGGASTLTIAPGATLIDAGTVDPLGAGASEVNVLNNSVTSFDVISGAKTAGLISGIGNTNVSSGSSLTAYGIVQNLLLVNGSVSIANRSISGLNRSSALSVVSSLTIAGATGNWTGKLDLGNSDLIVHNGNLPQLTDQIKSGYSNGTWQGTGGITSSAAGADTAHLMALGVIQDTSNGSPTGSTLYSIFDNSPATSSDVLLRYTYYGDTNLDGKVDASDYSRIDVAYATDKITPGSMTGWFNGDFNYDGVINGSDYTLIDNAFNTQGAALAANIADPFATVTDQLSIPTAVPEPSLLNVIGIATIGWLGKRKRFARTSESGRSPGRILSGETKNQVENS